MLSITIEEVIPIWLVNQLSRPHRAKIDLGFEKTAKKLGRAFTQWRTEFADGLAEQAEQRLPFADRARLSAERAARRRPKTDRLDGLIDCLLVAWFPVHEALCGLGNSEYGLHDIRTLSRQALEQIAVILDRAYDRDLHLGRNVPLAETWRKPHLIDASGTLTAGTMAMVERHRLWIKGQKMWLEIAERAAQPPSESLGPPTGDAEPGAAPASTPVDSAGQAAAKPQGPGAPKKPATVETFEKWLAMGKPQPSRVAQEMFPEEFADPKNRKKLTDLVGKRIKRCTEQPPT